MSAAKKKSKKISVDAGFQEVVGALRGLGGEHPQKSSMTVQGSVPDDILAGYYSVAGNIGERVFKGFDALDTEVQRIEGLMTTAVKELQDVEDDAANEIKGQLKTLDQIGSDADKK